MNDEIEGEVISKIFFNPDTGYFVARIQYDKIQPIVLGSVGFIEEGQILKAKGKWVVDVKHGRQFKATETKCLPPATHHGLVAFLSSTSIRGIGPSIAKKLVDVHGLALLDILKKNPEQLLHTKIKGIGEKKLNIIISAIKDHGDRIDVYTALAGYGISITYCDKLFNTYKQNALNVIQANPYRLIEEFKGIGFKIADNIAKKIGISKDSPFRIKSAVIHVMNIYQQRGFCGVLKRELLLTALMLVNGLSFTEEQLLQMSVSDPIFKIDKDTVGNIIKAMLDEGKVLIKDTVDNEECIFNKELYDTEKTIAQLIKNRLKVKPLDSHTIDQYITKAEKEKNFYLGAEQKMAVEKALAHNMLILTGGPGTGKTSTVNIITHIFNKLHKVIQIVAPSGKAAKRAQEVTGFEAKTIHRLLEVKDSDKDKDNDREHSKTKLKYHPNNPLRCDLLIVDESSMIDLPLFEMLIQAISADTTLIIVGDVDQLPSVGPGKVLNDLIESKQIATQRLTEIRRQAQDSSIIKLAYKINNAIYPSLKEYTKGRSIKEDLIYIPYNKETEKTNQFHIEDMIQYFKRKGFNPITDMQFLAPMRKGLFGIEYINEYLKHKLNPQKEQVKLYGYEYAINDKVMQLKNNKGLEIYNGDIGYIKELHPDDKYAIIQFDDRLIKYLFEDFNELSLAYCISIHKSQGGEFPIVFMCMTTSHFIMLKRNLAYTGVTRAKQHLVLMTDNFAMKTAIDTMDMQNRHTKLKEFLLAKD